MGDFSIHAFFSCIFDNCRVWDEIYFFLWDIRYISYHDINREIILIDIDVIWFK